MIERVVLVKLAPPYRAAADLAAIASQTREVLATIPEVLALRVGTFAEPRTGRQWHLLIEVQLQDLDAVERYRAHPAHRAYVDVFLRPMMEAIHVYGFEVPESPS